MASAGRIVASPTAIPTSLRRLTLGQPCAPFSLSVPRQERFRNLPEVQNGYFHRAPLTSQTRSLTETRNGKNPRQEVTAPICTNLGDQVNHILSTVVAVVATAMLASNSAYVEKADAVESLGLEAGAVFQRTCAGCHSGGGNILQPAATLFKKDLEKNGLAEVDDIYTITYSGKNRMPGYGEKCTPRGQCTFGPRLSEEDIRALAEFVKLQADQGWVQLDN